MNLMMLLEMASGTYDERVAVVNAGQRLTHAELFAAAGAAAATLKASGAEHLAFLGVSSLATPIGLFASAWAGLPFCPLNYRLTGSELDALLERVSPALLVTDAERAEQLAGRPGLTVTTSEAFLAEARAGGAAPGEWSMEPEDIAVLLFTSGTTGAPKAAVLRHKHLVSYILSSVEFAGAGEEEATLVSVPPYHIAARRSVL